MPRKGPGASGHGPGMGGAPAPQHGAQPRPPAPNPRPLVLLHGFTGAPDSWDAVRSGLPAGVRVLCPAIMGHASGIAPANDFAGEVDRLAAVIQASGWSGSHLCGYSLGGRLALGLLARHGSLFSGATLIGAHPGLAEGSPLRADRRASDARWAALAELNGGGAFFALWAEQPLFATQQALPASTLEAQTAIRIRHEARALAPAMRTLSLGSMPDWRPAMTGMTMPIRLMAGGLDQKFAALAHEMAALLPAARVTIVQGAGHNLPLERPEAVAAALSEIC